MNGCKCGFHGDPTRECHCTGTRISQCLGKISGPLLDRIDLHVEVHAVPFQESRTKAAGASSGGVRARGFINAEIPPSQIRKICPLDQSHSTWPFCPTPEPGIINFMGTLRITEAELARDVHAVLAKVQEGVEVIVEQDHRPVATIKLPARSGRLISECIASARASGSQVIPDASFASDVEEGIKESSQPWNPPSWD